MAIEWEETVETKRMVRLTVTHGPSCHDATVDDLRSACEAAGLVVETRERATADLEGRTNLREAYQKMHDERDACLDALSEHVSPDATADTPRMVRPSSVLAGIRSLQGRLRDARSDLREHDAALEAAVERRSEEADASTELARAILNAVPGEDIVSAARRTMASLGLTAARARAEKAESNIALTESRDTAVAERDDLRARLDRAEAATAEALAILNAMPGDDIVSAARHMMDVRMRQSVGREALRYSLATIVDEAFGAQPVMTHEELLSFLESRLRERTRDLAAARARIAELEAPMPEATITEIVDTFLSAERAHYKKNRFDHDAADRAGALAVAERVRRERCLIARAVAANIDVRVAEDVGGGFLVAAHRAGEGEHVEHTIPAAEVPATLARMLTEVGA